MAAFFVYTFKWELAKFISIGFSFPFGVEATTDDSRKSFCWETSTGAFRSFKRLVSPKGRSYNGGRVPYGVLLFLF